MNRIKISLDYIMGLNQKPWHMLNLEYFRSFHSFFHLYLNTAFTPKLKSCLRSGVGYPRLIDNDFAVEIFTPLLRQLNFWCACGMRPFFGKKKTASYLQLVTY